VAVTALVPTKLAEALFNAEVDYLTHEITGYLLKDTYTPGQDTHKYASDLDLASNEAAGTGYAAQVLTTKSVEVVGASNKVRLHSDPLSWPTSSVTARYCAIVDTETALAADQPVIVVVDFGENRTTDVTEFRVTPAADGWLYGVTP
jgi:hypothetical protein